MTVAVPLVAEELSMTGELMTEQVGLFVALAGEVVSEQVSATLPL